MVNFFKIVIFSRHPKNRNHFVVRETIIKQCCRFDCLKNFINKKNRTRKKIELMASGYRKSTSIA